MSATVIKGSTAPAITSPLMAWPARPVERASPLTSPTSAFGDSPTLPSFAGASSSSSSSSYTPTSGRRLEMDDRNGKGKAPEVVVTEDERRYAPPKRPLTPGQLGRIAQSFGIVIPSLPAPPPTSSPSRTVGSIAPTRGSPYLLTVIPPLNLLSADGEDKRRRWKRGRLLPLQPTIGSMLLCIAREYGLPSTLGVSLYLVVPASSSASSSSSTVSMDECAGPLISPGTWATLFSNYLHNAPSRSSSPSQTPTKTHGGLGREVTFPPSPLSLVDKHSAKRDRLHSFNSSVDPGGIPPAHGLPSALPPTPGSTSTQMMLGSQIVGTIEFDVDPDMAPWLVDYKRSGKGHRRMNSALSDSGIPARGGRRQLRLVQKVEDERTRGRAIDFGARDGESVESTADTTLVTEDEADTVPELLVEQQTGSTMLGAELGVPLDDFLASPIELEKAQMERVRMADGAKRASGLVMAEQLDDLERIMRQLSPREIRVTSPRALTPRMAAKVAAARLQADSLALPANPRAKPSSPLAASHTFEPAPSATVRSKTAPTVAGPKQDEVEGESALARPTWPAIPFGSPDSPNIDEVFRPQNVQAGVSAETLRRMQASPPKVPTSEWKPTRPPRPRSPDLTSFSHNRTLSHTLSPELLDQLRSPDAAAMSSPDAETTTKDKDGKPRLRGRAASVSMRGLRKRISGKNLHMQWGERDKEKEEIPAVPREKEAPVGLFKGASDIAASSSFASLREGQQPIDEFGQVTAAPAQGPGSAGSKHGLASRFFSFGRKSSAGRDMPVPAQRSVSAPKTTTISSPITSSFHRIESRADGRRPSDSSSHYPTSPPGSTKPLPYSPSSKSFINPPQSPQSPASPRSVKRKPVPGFDEVYEVPLDGIRGSESLSSMRSFVLDDPPKRRGKNLNLA